MDAPTGTSKIRFNRLLPYWAVLQTDLRQTLSGWVYRLWVMMAVVAVGASLVYKFGVQHEAGITQFAAAHGGNMLRGLVVGSLGLIALLAVSGVGGERTTVADAILSRGISRHQYFLAKLHSRLLVVLATFLALSLGSLAAFHYMLEGNLKLDGGLVAVGTVAAALAVIVTCGVTIGALANGTVMGITIFWVLLYGGIVGLSVLPESWPTPDVLLGVSEASQSGGRDSLPIRDVSGRMKNMLAGTYNTTAFTEMLVLCGGLCAAAAAVGMIGFSRKDV
jgi:ABC-2 type transport system permease protein